MKLIRLIIMSCLIGTYTFGQSIPTKKERYDFLKWYFKYKNLTSISTSTILFTNREFTIQNFNEAISVSKKINRHDLIYIDKQLKIWDENIIDTSLFRGINWKMGSSPELPEMSISLPVFTINRKIVIIKFDYYCGPTCGREEVEAFSKNRSGKWIRYNGFLFPTMVF